MCPYLTLAKKTCCLDFKTNLIWSFGLFFLFFSCTPEEEDTTLVVHPIPSKVEFNINGETSVFLVTAMNNDHVSEAFYTNSTDAFLYKTQTDDGKIVSGSFIANGQASLPFFMNNDELISRLHYLGGTTLEYIYNEDLSMDRISMCRWSGNRCPGFGRLTLIHEEGKLSRMFGNIDSVAFNIARVEPLSEKILNPVYGLRDIFSSLFTTIAPGDIRWLAWVNSQHLFKDFSFRVGPREVDGLIFNNIKLNNNLVTDLDIIVDGQVLEVKFLY